jgi:hypothetical protein
MNCLDCSTGHRTSQAVGACTTCGAGVCRDHLSLDTHVASTHSGVGAAHHFSTRAVTCAECAPVMTAMHHHRYQPGSPSSDAIAAGRR